MIIFENAIHDLDSKIFGKLLHTTSKQKTRRGGGDSGLQDF